MPALPLLRVGSLFRERAAIGSARSGHELTTVASATSTLCLGKNHRFGSADDEAVSPFEEISDHLGEGLRPFNHQRVAGVVNEHQMRVRNQLFVNAPHRCW